MRRALELACRVMAVAAIALLLLRALRPEVSATSVHATGAELDESLARWTHEPPARAQVAFAKLPSPRDRDWLAALARAGTRITWASEIALPALAVAAEPVPRPDHGVIVRLAAPHATTPVLHDDGGLIDSLTARNGGAAAWIPGVSGALRAALPRGTASAHVRDSLTLRQVLVLGTAGWESRFTITALEESGWAVAARLRVSPDAEVVQGAAVRDPIDTAHYSAVVAIDSVAAVYARAIGAFVRSGGGLVLAGQAAAQPAFASLRAGTPAARESGIIGAIRSGDPRRGLPLRPISAMRDDAIALDRLDDRVTLAARRVGAGRVMQSVFDDTWRWRMEGEGDAVAAHREWWNARVAGVAFASRTALEPTWADAADPAPLVALVDALGPASEPGDPAASRATFVLPTWLLFAVAVVALLAEWSSRRLRGAP